MVYIRLDIVNKEEYETSDIYREIKILIPRDSEDLERDFEYLGLDYKFKVIIWGGVYNWKEEVKVLKEMI